MVDSISEHVDHFIIFIQLFKNVTCVTLSGLSYMYFVDFLFQSMCDICLLCTEKEVNDALLGFTQLFNSSTNYNLARQLQLCNLWRKCY